MLAQMDFIPQFLNSSEFAFRRALNANRSAFILIAGTALLLAIALAFYMASSAALQQERLAANNLLLREHQGTASIANTIPSKISLKDFRSSHLLAILEQGASVASVKLDEISFAIEDSPSQPFVRYRASFTLLSRYPTIRKFISEILAGSEGVVLDTVTCRREAVTVADVRCDISAYVAYQEKAGG